MCRADSRAARPFLAGLLALAFALAACTPDASPPPEGEGATPAPSHDTSGELPLPELVDCASTAHPMLPAKWTATALMQDFFLNTLWFGSFVYDEAASAFRFSVADRYGIDFDLLTTTDGTLYLLEGGGDMPTSCSRLSSSSPFTVPTRDWLATKAVCVGQAPLLDQDQQWWKSPSGEGANWYWYDVSDAHPFRNMFYAAPTAPAPIYEYFTFNYFPTFEAVDATNLGQILQMCQGAGAAQGENRKYAAASIEALLQKSHFPDTDAVTISKIQGWLPGISECSSTGSLPPDWPDQLQMTAFMTAVSFEPNPFPTRIYYDWTRKSQNTTLYYYPPAPDTYAQVALLLGDTGYIAIQEEGGGYASCQQVLPGPPVTNWKDVDGCECRAEIAPHTALNPSDVPTKVLWCPTDLELRQVFWTWYSDTGTPIVFMQSNSSPTAGTGLNLADYYEWGPGSVAPAGTFDLPQICQGKPKVPDAFPKACNHCHLPLSSGGSS